VRARLLYVRTYVRACHVRYTFHGSTGPHTTLHGGSTLDNGARPCPGTVAGGAWHSAGPPAPVRVPATTTAGSPSAATTFRRSCGRWITGKGRVRRRG
jgi:hypothetical protein